MIDLHSHVLAGIDDGPPTIADAIALARAATAAGCTALVTTPHIDNAWGVDPLAVPAAVEEMRAVLKAAEVPLELHAGGEVALDRLLTLTSEERDAVRLGGGPYLLIESPHTTVAGAFERVVHELLMAGERVVLAHPERSPIFQRRSDALAELVEAGALCSITAGSMMGRFGNSVRRFTAELLRLGLVHNVASDAHGIGRRPPGLLAGFHALEPELPGLTRNAEWMTETVPAAILAGDQVGRAAPLGAGRPSEQPRQRRARWFAR